MTASSTADTVRGRDELLVYVDYDGNLHHENVWWSPEKGPFIKAAAHFTLFQHAELLADVLRPYLQLRTAFQLRSAQHGGSNHDDTE